MSIYQAVMAAFENRDSAALIALYHPDFTFVRHQTNTTLSLEEWKPMMEGMMASGKWELLDSHCVYENDEIMVSRNLMAFPDGSKESVMGVNILKDGKILRIETGATPIND